MNGPSHVRSSRYVGALVLALASVTSCGEPPTVVPPPQPGSVSLAVRTTGSDPDQDGYTVTLDDSASRNVSPNATVSFTDVQPGSHTLALAGVASNCSAGPSNPLSVSVQSDATASAAFDVQCGVIMAASGGTASTLDGKARVDVPSGALADSTIVSVVPAPDSSLPASASGFIGGSAYQYLPDSATFAKPVRITIVYDASSVPAGTAESSLRLQTVQDGQWVPVTGSTVDTSLHTVTGQVTHFSIYGAAVARPGVLEVTTATSGVSPDSDGYRLRVDGGAGRHMAIDDTVDVAGLSVGSHTVQLDSVASNCSVSGGTTRTVSVAYGDTVTVAFEIACVSRTGSLSARTTTSGTDLDPNGYTLTVDGGKPVSIGIDDAVTLTDVPVGDHTVTLGDVAANCTVSGGTTRTVSVVHGDTAAVDFSVGCAPNQGDVRASATTSGTDLDSNGYTVALDGGKPAPISSPSGSHLFTHVPVGGHTVTLGGVAENCTVQGGATRHVDVTYADTATASFSVACVADVGSVRVSNSTTGTDLDPDGYEVSVDGGATRTMDTNGSVIFPDVSVGKRSAQLVASSVAPNCTVTSANPTSVQVAFGDTATATFSVSCAPDVGSIEVTTSANGKNRPANFSVSLDDGPGHTIKPDKGSYTFSSVPVGSHVVTLTVPSECTVTSADPQPLDVTFGETTKVSFTATCP